MANVFLGIYLNQSVWYKLSDKTKYGAYISVIGAILTIVINILFIPTYGYKAAAWATLIVYATQMTLSYFWGQKHFPIKYNRRKFALYLGSTIVFYFISQFISFENTLLSFLKNNLFVVLFVLLVLKIEGISLKKILKRA
jgi:O-antigen/teichoic acid export membrane protein